MANEEHDEKHIEILRQGVEVWNKWRRENPQTEPVLLFADLRATDLVGINLSRTRSLGTNFTGANLSEAILTGALLTATSFEYANLSRANLNEVKVFTFGVFNHANFSRANLYRADFSSQHIIQADFSRAKLIETNLSMAFLMGTSFVKANLDKANLMGAALIGADFSEASLQKTILGAANLQNANLQNANLRNANLTRADLIDVDFTGADLSEANLSQVIALRTNFENAIFTGACIKSWNINSDTNLNNVICNYVYIEKDQQERRPHNGNFAPGEFALLVQDLLGTIDLIFKEGVNWKAFTYSFTNIQLETEGSPLAIQSITNKGNGAVVIKVSVSPVTNKEKIAGDFWQGYEFAKKALESQYQERLEDKDKHINQLFYLLDRSSQIQGEVQKRMAETPKYNIQSSKVYGFAPETHGSGLVSGETVRDNEVVGTQHNYAPEQRQNLAEAAAEIQQLLKQLEETYPSATEEEKETALAIKVQQEIKRNPTFKARLRNALKEGGIEALKVLFAPVGIPIEMVRGWIEAEAE
jgi:uncharacterized protein YjbI with pentapeptide repeats